MKNKSASLLLAFIALLPACEPMIDSPQPSAEDSAELLKRRPKPTPSPSATPTPAPTVAPVDNIAPTITAFTLPSTANSATVPILSFAATDNVGVTGFMLTETSVAPSASAAGWSASQPASYTLSGITPGVPISKTIYAWAKDAAGNISVSRSFPVSVTLPKFLFHTDFENAPDWVRSRPAKGSTGYDWPAAWAQFNGGNPIYPPPKKDDGTFLFDLFRVGPTLFDPPYVTNMLEVRGTIGRGGSRGMLYNVEVSGAVGVWTGGDAMHIWLGTSGYTDLHVRFMLRYPPEWKWTDDNNPISNRGAYQKIMKIARYNGTWGDGGNPAQYVAPSNGGRVHPVWIPDWYQYISTTPSQTYFYKSERFSPDYTANNPATDFHSTAPQFYPAGAQFKWPTDSDWHCYEFRARMNSAPGVADGISEVWLDGVKVWSKTNIAWVKAGGSVATGWNDVTILDNATIPAHPLASQVTYPLYLDDVAISTSYIGPPVP